MRFREVSGWLPGLSRVSSTERRGARGLSASTSSDEAERPSGPVPRSAPPRLVSPTEQVVLEVPALRARRLVRLQGASTVVVSIVAGLLAMLYVALPAEDRSLTLIALGLVVALMGIFVGVMDYIHGRCVGTLVTIASQLRQSAAERAADLARTNAELRRRELERALAGRLEALYLQPDRHGDGARVLVVGGDVTWRRRVSLILEARGIRAAEAAHAEEAASEARRVPARAVVADLLLADPGGADLLTRLTAEETMRQVPVLLVRPGALSPGQQRDLRRELARWSRERLVPVSEFAAAVAEAAGLPRAEIADLVVGEGGWRAH